MTATNEASAVAMRERLVSLTRDLVLIPSSTDRPEELRRGMEFCRNHLDDLSGVTLDIEEWEGIPNLVVLPSGIPRPRVLLCAHLDVVAHGDAQTYRSAVRDGRIYGPGAGDMKGQLAVLMDLFRECHTESPGCSVGIIVTGDEEIGGMNGTRRLFEERGLRCDLAILPDGGSLDEVIVEEKGVLRLNLAASGESAHGAYPWLAENPIETLIDIWTSLRAFFEELEDADSVERWYPTASLTILTTPNRTTNRIPAEAEAALDIRFTPPWTGDSLLGEIWKRVDGRASIEVVLSDEPSHLAPDPVYLEVVEECLGKKPKLRRACGASDARFICPHGIPVILSRPEVGNVHAEEEWIDIESMVTFRRILEAYLRRRLAL